MLKLIQILRQKLIKWYGRNMIDTTQKNIIIECFE